MSLLRNNQVKLPLTIDDALPFKIYRMFFFPNKTISAAVTADLNIQKKKKKDKIKKIKYFKNLLVSVLEDINFPALPFFHQALSAF